MILTMTARKTSTEKKRTRIPRLKQRPTPSEFGVFDNRVMEHIDVLQVALVRAGRNTLIPELYEVFGKDNLLKFLDLFSGTTIEVPSKLVLENAIRDTFIYLAINRAKKNPRVNVNDVKKDLMDRYHITRDQVEDIYKDMHSFSPSNLRKRCGKRRRKKAARGASKR